MEQLNLNEQQVKELFYSLKSKKVLLIRGKGSFTRCGAESWLEEKLGNCEVTAFSDFQVNPEIADLHRGIELFRRTKPDAVIAAGGGSVLDMGKMIRFFGLLESSTPDSWLDDNNSEEPSGHCELIAIPTTSGTGAESTHFAVLYRDKTKYSVAHERILPDKIILKPELTMAMSPFLCAVTGMDAFCQALEAWWSRNHTMESRRYSEEAMGLVLKYLLSSIQGQEDARREMQKAAWLGGKAINIAKTTAVHAFSYILTSRFGLPHGHALSLLLPYFMELNLEGLDNNDREYIREILDIKTGDEKNWARRFIDSAGIDRSLECGKEELVQLLKDNVNLQRLKNNPVEVTESAIKELAEDLLN